MKTGTTLVTTLFALASFPLLAQQPPPASQPTRPATQQNPSASEPASPNNPAASPETPAIEMSPVKGELVSTLDSKTAKTGDIGDAQSFEPDRWLGTPVFYCPHAVRAE